MCQLGWSGRAVCRFAFLDGDSAGNSGTPAPVESDPPEWIEALVAEIRAHLAGEKVAEFEAVPVVFGRKTPFCAAVYAALRAVPAGHRTTYAELAVKAGRPKAFRAVGQAMAKNPIPLIVPCHRVVRSDGTLGGYSAPGTIEFKRKLLAIESRQLRLP